MKIGLLWVRCVLEGLLGGILLLSVMITFKPMKLFIFFGNDFNDFLSGLISEILIIFIFGGSGYWLVRDAVRVHRRLKPKATA